MLGLFILAVAAVSSLIAVIATYYAIEEKDLIKAVIYSAVQSTMFALLYYLFVAPDIVLVYVPVAVGLYPLLVIMLIKKTERYEEI